MSDENLPVTRRPPPEPYHYGQQAVPAQFPGYGYAQTSIVQARVGGAHVAIAWIFAVFSLGYFLPWAIAATRQKSNTLAIGLVNFLVGWTGIGWVAALVMACLAEPAHITNVAYAAAPVLQVHSVTPSAPAGWYPDGTGIRRYWDGQGWTQHTAP